MSEDKIEKTDVLRYVVEEEYFIDSSILMKELELLALKMLGNSQKDTLVDKVNWDLEKELIDGRMSSTIWSSCIVEFEGSKWSVNLEIEKIEKKEAGSDDC